MLSAIETPLLLIRRLSRRLGVRVTAFALVALGISALAPLAEGALGDGLTGLVGREAVMPVLTILASSMLAVSTFSINVMVSAYRAAAASATPRVHRLLLEDTTTQTVLSTFIGAFVYALTSILLFQTGAMADDAAVIVMAMTVLIVFLVITAMLRWIHHLSVLGSVDHSLEVATARARETLRRFARAPALGGIPLTDDTVLPQELQPVRASASGYIQLIDVAMLERCLPDGAFLYLRRIPGDMVLEGTVIAEMSGTHGPPLAANIAEAVVIGPTRSYEQDPEFGLLVLSEIASKALSPGINDPGTAIIATDKAAALLWDHARTEPEPTGQRAPRVFVPVNTTDDLFEAAFAATARTAAGTPEVVGHLLEVLNSLAEAPGCDRPATEMAARVLDHAERSIDNPHDLETLRARAPAGRT
ncbi:MAG: DUF2254 domain-containing protein [Pseudomonadota bacterium]